MCFWKIAQYSPVHDMVERNNRPGDCRKNNRLLQLTPKLTLISACLLLNNNNSCKFRSLLSTVAYTIMSFMIILLYVQEMALISEYFDDCVYYTLIVVPGL